MTMTIDIPADVAAKVEAEAAKHGQELKDYLGAAIERLFPPDAEAARIDAGWDALAALINDCQVDTGIEDLAHQHDHYLHGTPKREE